MNTRACSRQKVFDLRRYSDRLTPSRYRIVRSRQASGVTDHENIAAGGILERIRRLAPPHVTAPFKTVAEWREWQLSEGQKRCEEINRQNRQLRVEKF